MAMPTDFEIARWFGLPPARLVAFATDHQSGPSSAAAHTVALTAAKLTIRRRRRLSIGNHLRPAGIPHAGQARPLGSEISRRISHHARCRPGRALTDARQSLREQIQFDFGGQISYPSGIVLPAADQLRDQFKPDGGGLFLVVAEGSVPPGASHFTVKFPAEFESVALVVYRPARRQNSSCFATEQRATRSR